MKRALVLIFALILFVVANVHPASAHAKLDKCTPAVNATIAQAPTQVVCKFTEEIDAKQSLLSVFDASNMQVDKKDTKADLNDADRMTLVVSLDTAMMKNGVYTVKWKAFTPDDNGVNEGSFNFLVGTGTLPTAVPTTASAKPDGKISFVAPQNGATLPAGDVNIQVATENIKLGDDYHWHLYIDGKSSVMVMEGAVATKVRMTAGSHELKVVVAGKDHNDIPGMSSTIRVNVTGNASSGGTDNTTLALAFVGGGVVVGLIALVAWQVTRKKK